MRRAAVRGVLAVLLAAAPGVAQASELFGVARVDGAAWTPAVVRVVGRPVPEAPWVGAPIDRAVPTDAQGRFRVEVPAGVVLHAWIEDPDGVRRSALRRVWAGRPERFDPDPACAGPTTVKLRGVPAELLAGAQLRVFAAAGGVVCAAPLSAAAAVDLDLPVADYQAVLLDAQGRPRWGGGFVRRPGSGAVEVVVESWRARRLEVRWLHDDAPVPGASLVARVADLEVELGVTDAGGGCELSATALPIGAVRIGGPGIAPALFPGAPASISADGETWIARVVPAPSRSGRLRDFAGQPLAGVVLLRHHRFVGRTDARRSHSLPGVSVFRCDDEGRFRIDGIAADGSARIDALVDDALLAGLPARLRGGLAPVAWGLLGDDDWPEFDVGGGRDPSLARLMLLDAAVADPRRDAVPIAGGYDVALHTDETPLTGARTVLATDAAGVVRWLHGGTALRAIWVESADGEVDVHPVAVDIPAIDVPVIDVSAVEPTRTAPPRIRCALPLRPLQDVTGTVRNAAGQPAAGVALRFAPSTGTEFPPAPGIGFAAERDAAGFGVEVRAAATLADLVPCRADLLRLGMARADREGGFRLRVPAFARDWTLAVGGVEVPFRVGAGGTAPLQIESGR